MLGALGCQGSSRPSVSIDITPEIHSMYFPIGLGTVHELGATMADGTVQCVSCHPTGASSFTQITCVGCHGHDQTVTDRLHLTVPKYAFTDSTACYGCHPTGGKTQFDHAGISNNCQVCHDAGNPFAALPVPNLVHPETGGVDCSGCHNTTDWAGATGAPNAHDPAHDVVLTASLPTFDATSIATLSAQSQTLSMIMNHGSADAPTAVMSDCKSCHPNVNKTGYFPGTFHASLNDLDIAQPTSCSSCHLDTMPMGFVGPVATNPARVPPSGEMRHEAVGWVKDAPTSTRIVTTDCGICHRSPSGNNNNKVDWTSGKSGDNVKFHAALNNAGVPQPASCLDCHANSRPQGALTSRGSSLSAGISFDHAGAMGDCAACHAASAAPSWSSWKQGKYHLAGDATPATCLPCHAGERPTSTSSWSSSTYKTSPFDYGTNVAGSTHGDGQDCAQCHAGPGTGAWGGTETWAGGHFNHGAGTPSATSCIVCHSTQRPICSRAAARRRPPRRSGSTTRSTAPANASAATLRPRRPIATSTTPTRRRARLPGGDWKGGLSYPGSTFAGSDDQFINVTETTLKRDGTAANTVLSATTVTDTIYNGMLHASTILPASLAAGPTNAPDNTKCWHCHTNTNGVVTVFRNGLYHDALTNFRASPSGAVASFAQPTSQCSDCHVIMMPDGIVELNGSDLWPMDHTAVLATRSPSTARPWRGCRTSTARSATRAPARAGPMGSFTPISRRRRWSPTA